MHVFCYIYVYICLQSGGKKSSFDTNFLFIFTEDQDSRWNKIYIYIYICRINILKAAFNK